MTVTSIKVRFPTKFPSSVDATSPLTLDRSGGHYTFGFDANAFDVTPNIVAVLAAAPPITVPASGLFYFPDVRINRFNDRVFVGDATYNTGANLANSGDWLTTFQLGTGRANGFVQSAQSAILQSVAAGSNSAHGLVVGAQTNHFTSTGNAVGSTNISINNNSSQTTNAYASYNEAYRMSGSIGGAYGYEIDTVNYASLVAINPFTQNIGQTIGLQLAAGAELSSTGQFPSSAAINIRKNGATYHAGIIFGNDAIDGTDGTTGEGEAIALATGHVINYYYADFSVSWQFRAAPGLNGNYSITTNGGGSYVIGSPVYGVSFNTTGGSGAGYFQLGNQPSAPSTPTTALRLYADNSNRLGWVGTNGFAAQFDPTANTANRTYTLPDASGAVTLNNNTATLTGKTYDTAGSGNVFKINGTTVTTAANLQAVVSGGIINYTLNGVNFNSANTDTQIPITLPTGSTRYVVAVVVIDGASASITTATAGLFTATGGGGVAVCSTQALTVNTAADATNGNAQAMNVNNSITQSYTVAGQPNLYFRVVTPQGSAATASVVIQIRPLP